MSNSSGYCKKNKRSRLDASATTQFGADTGDGDLLKAVNSGSFSEAIALLRSNNTFTQDVLSQVLISACRQGHKFLVQTLVQVGANIEYQDERGNTPLLICVENGFTDIVRFLVSRQANVNAVNYVGNTALILSVRPAGSLDLTRFLLEQVIVDIHHENQLGHTALTKATLFMDVDIMRLLLEKSMGTTQEKDYSFFTSKSQKDSHRNAATEIGLRDVFEILMKHLITKTSPLELAIKAGDTQSLTVFLDCQFRNKEEKKPDINNALKYMIQESYLTNGESSNSRDVKIIEKLLQYRADVNQYCRPRLINLAVESGNLQLVELLCKYGADLKVDQRYSLIHEQDPLSIAAKNGRQDLIELLLKYKADVNGKYDTSVNGTCFYDSPLDYALRNDRPECVELLIQHGARMDVERALTSAVIQQVPGYMNFLFQNYNGEITNFCLSQSLEARDLLTLTAEKGNCEIICQILDAGVDINGADCLKKTPLMTSKNGEVAEFLIQRGADVNREVENSSGTYTALGHVIQYSDLADASTVELCKVLIDNGAAVNYRSKKYETPLMIAAREDRCEVILQMLLDNGADVNAKDIDGNTALHHLLIACDKNTGKILTSLIKAGSHVNCQNNDGLSPLMLAAKKKIVSVLTLLLEAGADLHAVSEKNPAQTALSFLPDIRFCASKILISCIDIFIKRGAKCSYLRHQFIHKLIISNHIEVISELVQHGVGPAEVAINKIDTRIKKPALSTVSPLCVALLLGNVQLAQYFVEIMFLTASDLSMFASNKAMELLLEKEGLKDSLNFLQEQSSQPMTLEKLSLVAVSAAVGSSPGRETRVDSLPLPQLMKDRLLFKSVSEFQPHLDSVPNTSRDNALLFNSLRDRLGMLHFFK